MRILVVGATGATGRLLVEQLLERGHEVRVLVRSPDRLPAHLRSHDAVTITEAAITSLRYPEWEALVRGCDAVASCLGHNLSFTGIFGPPRRLVTDTARAVCEAIRANAPDCPVKFVLMNTAGNRNRDRDEPVSRAQRIVVGLIRILIPPHADNEDAADCLRVDIGQVDPHIEWTVVRPDSLQDEDVVTAYDTYAAPTRSAIFDPGKTSRINVAHFMAELITNEEAWKTWKGQMPVIYNRSADSA